MNRSTVKLVHAKWRSAAQLHMEGVHPNHDAETRSQYAYWLVEIRGCFPMRDYGVTWC